MRCVTGSTRVGVLRIVTVNPVVGRCLFVRQVDFKRIIGSTVTAERVLAQVAYTVIHIFARGGVVRRACSRVTVLRLLCPGSSREDGYQHQAQDQSQAQSSH
ncbi:hypothetical protein KKC1_24120 [Calderihabitans maritimus]|uniref:Uncharacterized protein n=1 Tax=Calderihabitans maritimus TaxID=1246530 RepID=A0A1Z5HUR4_9FIRM|nr:hypothetical protein KKC1_24120 [Calderihabitans maritimus]